MGEFASGAKEGEPPALQAPSRPLCLRAGNWLWGPMLCTLFWAESLGIDNGPNALS